MGIYISGMEMPKDGAMIVAIRPDGKVEDVMGCYVGEVIPVPDHGRLIDADELAEAFTPDPMYYPTEEDRREYDNFRICMRDVRGDIKTAPTVIPAEEGE